MLNEGLSDISDRSLLVTSNFDFKSPFPLDSYNKYVGLDDTSLFATSMAISDDERFAVVGADGYSMLNYSYLYNFN